MNLKPDKYFITTMPGIRADVSILDCAGKTKVLITLGSSPL